MNRTKITICFESTNRTKSTIHARGNGHGPKNRLVHRCMPSYIMLTKLSIV